MAAPPHGAVLRALTQFGNLETMSAKQIACFGKDAPKFAGHGRVPGQLDAQFGDFNTMSDKQCDVYGGCAEFCRLQHREGDPEAARRPIRRRQGAASGISQMTRSQIRSQATGPWRSCKTRGTPTSSQAPLKSLPRLPAFAHLDWIGLFWR